MRLRRERLDLQLIGELVELLEVDAGTEPADVGLDAVALGGTGPRRCEEPSANDLVEGLLERHVSTMREVLDLLHQVGLERDRRPHGRSLMLLLIAVKLPHVRICFVCMGNICRSPTAEGVMAKLVGDAGLADVVELDSA